MPIQDLVGKKGTLYLDGGHIISGLIDMNFTVGTQTVEILFRVETEDKVIFVPKSKICAFVYENN